MGDIKGVYGDATGNMDRDEIFYPLKKKELRKCNENASQNPIFTKLYFGLGLGWFVYLIEGIVSDKCHHHHHLHLFGIFRLQTTQRLSLQSLRDVIRGPGFPYHAHIVCLYVDVGCIGKCDIGLWFYVHYVLLWRTPIRVRHISV